MNTETHGQEEELDEYESDSPYCECNEIPTIEEEEWNVCMCCGKPLFP